jgi:hypothetical protein
MVYTVHRDTKEMVCHIFFEADVQESFRFNDVSSLTSENGKAKQPTPPLSPHQDNFKILKESLNGFFQGFFS